MIYGMS